MKYLICNLKAHKTIHEILDYEKSLQKINTKEIELIMAPQDPYLAILKSDKYSICSQNIPLYNDLYLTGDTNIEALKSIGVTYTIIGHYERRKYYKETELEIKEKINQALKENIKVIYCIGETLEEHLRKVDYQVLERQIARILNFIPNKEFKNIIIAYEPTYMIGNKEHYDFKKIESNIQFIKNIIDNYYHGEIKVVYGGSINLDNISDFCNIKYLDGLMVSRSILEVKNITKIIENMTTL